MAACKIGPHDPDSAAVVMLLCCICQDSRGSVRVIGRILTLNSDRLSAIGRGKLKHSCIFNEYVCTHTALCETHWNRIRPRVSTGVGSSILCVIMPPRLPHVEAGVFTARAASFALGPDSSGYHERAVKIKPAASLSLSLSLSLSHSIYILYPTYNRLLCPVTPEAITLSLYL